VTSKNDCDFSRSPGLEILVDEATDERPGLLQAVRNALQPKGRGWQVCTNSRTAVCLFPSTTPNDVPDSVTTSEVAMNFYELL